MLIQASDDSTKHQEPPQDGTSDSEVIITETFHHPDPRGNCGQFRNEKQDELSVLVPRDALHLIRRTSVSTSANILNGLFVLSVKATDTPLPVYKAIFIEQRHRYRGKHSVVHNCSTARPPSVRLDLTVFTMCGYALGSFDVTKAYLQSTTNLAHAMYVRPLPALSNPTVQPTTTQEGTLRTVQF